MRSISGEPLHARGEDRLLLLAGDVLADQRAAAFGVRHLAEDPAAKLTVTDLDDEPGRNERVADDADNPSSDIDWGILNDEFF